MKKLKITILVLVVLSVLSLIQFYFFISNDLSEIEIEIVEEQVRDDEVEDDAYLEEYRPIFDEDDRINMNRVHASQVDQCWFKATYDGHFFDPETPRKKCTVSWFQSKNEIGTSWFCSSFRREYCCQRFESLEGFPCQHVPYDVQAVGPNDWSADIMTAESKHWVHRKGTPIWVGRKNETTMFSIVQLESIERFSEAHISKEFWTENPDKRLDSAWGYSEDVFPNTMLNFMPDLAHWKYLLDMKDIDYDFENRDFTSIFQSQTTQRGCLNWERVQFIRYFVRTSEKLYKGIDEKKIVHSYGKICNNAKVNKTDWNGRYEQKDSVNMKHKFYLALENYLDDWTATPRIWSALYTGTVPVVVAGTKIGEMWPFKNKGYIDVRDFGDVKSEQTWEKVLKYMYELAEDEELWMEYQKWREEVHVTKEWYERWGSRSLSNFMCNICEYYHEEFLPKGGHKNLETDKIKQKEYMQKYVKFPYFCTKVDMNCDPYER